MHTIIEWPSGPDNRWGQWDIQTLRIRIRHFAPAPAFPERKAVKYRSTKVLKYKNRKKIKEEEKRKEKW